MPGGRPVGCSELQLSNETVIAKSATIPPKVVQQAHQNLIGVFQQCSKPVQINPTGKRTTVCAPRALLEESGWILEPVVQASPDPPVTTDSLLDLCVNVIVVSDLAAGWLAWLRDRLPS